MIDKAREQMVEADRSGGITNPIDPEPSLAWLVAEGEIQHRDLVLPNVDRRAGTLYWAAWGEKYLTKSDPEVLWMAGYHHHDGLPITGEQPVHFHVWYRNDAEALIIQLVEELEALPKNE